MKLNTNAIFEHLARQIADQSVTIAMQKVQIDQLTDEVNALTSTNEMLKFSMPQSELELGLDS